MTAISADAVVNYTQFDARLINAPPEIDLRSEITMPEDGTGSGFVNGQNCPLLRWYVDHVRPM